MPYEEDEARRAARERLQARMERRGSATGTDSANSVRPPRTTSYSPEREPRDAGEPSGVQGALAGARDAIGSAVGSVAERVREARDGRATQSSPRVDRAPGYLGASEGNRTVEVGPVSFDLPFDLPEGVPPIVVPIAAAVIVLLLVFAVLVPSCTRSSEPASQGQPQQTAQSGQAQGSASAQAAAGSAASANTSSTVDQVKQAKIAAEQSVNTAGANNSIDAQESHEAALVKLLGDDTSVKLLAQARTNIDALWIAAHPDAFAFDGVEVQYKVMKLAADEPAAVDYVRAFPSSYPAETVNEDKSLAMSASSPVSTIPETNIPHLYQWDRRWGYTTYSSAAFGLTGCGPTSLAMVYQGLTGKTDKSPYDMGKLADDKGYMSEYEGTIGTFFTDVAEELGLACEEIYPDAEGIRSALEHGQIVIANLAPGTFTTTGHYFVITSLTSDGQAIVNDPYSVERSSQTWDLDTIASQSYVLYGYTKAS